MRFASLTWSLSARSRKPLCARTALHIVAFFAIGCVATSVCIAPAAAAPPSLTGHLTVHFAFTPGDPGVWNYNGHSENLVLAMPPVLEISAIPGPGILSWSTPANWSTFPLDTSGLALTTSGSGSYHATINNGNLNADVLNGSGPTEGSIRTRIDVTDITPSGQGPCPTCVFTVFSNFADTRYNVTVPSGAHVNIAQSNVNVQNLTVNSGGKVTGVFAAVRNNLTNHGSGNFEGTVEGNFINDAVAANGDVANAQVLILQGQLHNTGGLHVPNYFETRSATSNAGFMGINGGQFHARAAFANSGTMVFSAGSLHGPGTVTNNGTFQWTGGQIVGTAGQVGSVVNTSSAFTISGSGGNAPHMFGPLTNSGTITQSGNTSSLTISGQTTLTNQAGALYNIVDDSSINSGGGTFSNAGTFRKSGGTGTSLVNSAFTNTGTIQVDTGTLKFTGGGTLNSGTISIASGSVAEIAGGGDFSVIGSNPASGGGTLKISSGHVFVANGNSGSFTNFTDGVDLLVTDNGNLEANAGGTLTLNLTGTSSVQVTGNGKVGGTGTTTNLGNFQWTGGSVVGNLTNASANFTVGGSQGIQGGNLSNTGTITQSNTSNLQIGGGGTLTNQAGGLYDITDNSQITGLFGSVTNAGTFRKSGGSGTSLIGVPFTNTGTLAIHTGTLQVGLTLSSSSTLEFKLSGTTAGQDYGKLFAVPTLAAAGTLKVTLAPAFNPALGNSFDILDWSNSVSGFFSSLSLPALNAGLAWNVDNLYTTGVIAVAAGVPGDYSNNGLVDAADYVLWRNGGPLANEVDLPGTVNAADYTAWRARFGNPGGGAGAGAANLGATGSASTTVPEPTTQTIFILTMLLMFARQRARKS